jgi:hypothetical protein
MRSKVTEGRIHTLIYDRHSYRLQMQPSGKEQEKNKVLNL